MREKSHARDSRVPAKPVNARRPFLHESQPSTCARQFPGYFCNESLAHPAIITKIARARPKSKTDERIARAREALLRSLFLSLSLKLARKDFSSSQSGVPRIFLLKRGDRGGSKKREEEKKWSAHGGPRQCDASFSRVGEELRLTPICGVDG